MFLFEQEGSGVRRARLDNLVERVLHRLGDSAQTVWTYAEIEGYLQTGTRELAAAVPVVWDRLYLENLPAGFHCTADWEEELADFRYGVASYTYPEELLYIDDEEMEHDEIYQANHTSPSDIHYLEDIGASTAMRGTVELPDELVAIERATWDNRGIDATSPGRLRQADDQYQETAGEVFAYSWRHEGPRTFRKIRVPAVMADTYEVDGNWGILCDPSDIGDPEVEGTWGLPRRIPYHYPMGDAEGWGLARRVYRDGKNVCVEHFRRPTVTATESEIPDRYNVYLAHYCQWKALVRNGPGQDYKLAQLYKTWWDRGLVRIRSRSQKQSRDRIGRWGGTTGTPSSSGRPPRPKLPWQYGSTVR